jgi:uncharacterized protein YndB with AHSA1/START domain
MRNDYVAKASTTINASSAVVWDALVNPESIKKYMFGTTVTTNWHEGSPIYWKGEWKGRSYEDKGIVLHFRPPHNLEYSHYSPLSGKPDVPENYHTVSIELKDEGNRTHVSLRQDNNPTEEAREHSQKNWETMLKGLKQFVEHRESA